MMNANWKPEHPNSVNQSTRFKVCFCSLILRSVFEFLSRVAFVLD